MKPTYNPKPFKYQKDTMRPLQIFNGKFSVGRKQISILCKLGSCRIKSLYTYCIILFLKFECEKYLENLFRKCSLIEKGSKHNVIPVKEIIEMEKNISFGQF